MKIKQRIILACATIGYIVFLYSFLTQDLWVMLISMIISTSLLIAFNLVGNEKEEAMMTSLELEEAYKKIDSMQAENDELKSSMAKKEDEIKEAEQKTKEAMDDVLKAKEEAQEAFKQNEEYKKQIEEAKADTKKVREDEKFRSLLPPVEGPGTSEVNIVSLTSETIEEFDSFASKMDIIIRMVSVSKDIAIMANKNRLRVMLRNIIDNSLKYMNKAGVLVITISEVNDDVFIVCKDNGQGLPENETVHVFELNFQGSNRISGNGLGLAQAKAIVDYYKGDIYAKSNEGNGMAIYIKLPKSQELEAQQNIDNHMQNGVGGNVDETR